VILVSGVDKGIAVARLLKQIRDSIRRNVEHEFRELNLTAPQGMLMGILSRAKEIKIGDLSKKMGLSNSTVSGIIDRLEKQGLVERVRCEKDRRVIYVRISEEFQRKANEQFCGMEKRFKTIMNQATKEELDKIIEGLEIFKKLFDRDTEGKTKKC
jgi:DNA-binding MarR family transcriptional regulator